MNVRRLNNKDLPAIRELLWQYPDTSLFILGNLELAPVEYSGNHYEGHYFGAFEGEALRGLIVKYWNGNLMPQGSLEAVDAIWQQTPELQDELNGFIGRDDLCLQLRAKFDAQFETQPEYSLDSQEVLYSLDLENLIVPPALSSGELAVKLATPDDLSFLKPWMIGYNVETLNATHDEDLEKHVEESVLARAKLGNLFVLWQGDTPLATSGFNAKVSSLVQIGGVYTPPEHRRNGYARTCVAGSLQTAIAEGISKSILFTDQENIGARTAYERIGYQHIGYFGLYIIKS